MSDTPQVEELFLTVPCDTGHLGTVRRVSECVLKMLGFSEQELNRTMVALSEAFSNVIRHSCCEESSSRFDVTYYVSSDVLRVRVRDFCSGGKDFDIDKACQEVREKLTPGGFGVRIMKNVMENVEYSSSPIEGNVLWLTKEVK